MDDTWLGIKKEDFMWFGPYCPQCAYGVGTEPFAYIYSKDCNRDVILRRGIYAERSVCRKDTDVA